MIEILHLATSFGRGGAELNLERLASNMDPARFSTTVVSMRRRYDNNMVERLTHANVGFRCLEMSPGVPHPTALFRLVRIIREVRPRVLQTWMYHADLLGLLAGTLARVPVIVWNVRSTLLNNRGLARLVFRSLVPLSHLPAAVVANSQAGVRLHTDLGYKPKQWVWIPNTLDSTQFRPDPRARGMLRRQLRLHLDSFLIGLVARFDPMKDHANFIRAASLLAGDNPKVDFVMMGEGIDPHNACLASLLESARPKARFHLLGLRDDVNCVTAGLDIACSSSAYGEGTSNAVAEAMACEVPCVVTDVGDSALLVGNTGIVVPPKNPLALARALSRLMALSPECRLDFGRKARRRVEEHYCTSSVVTQYEALYERLALLDR